MISVMYAGNDRMFDGLIISAISTVKHTRETVNAYILTMDLTDVEERFKPITEAQRIFVESIYKSVNPESNVSLIDVGELYRAHLGHSPNSQTGYTPYTFLRLFADRLPDIPDKVLYLDTDIVINGDLSTLFHTDIEGYEYAAALDYYGKIFMGYHYINAGVLLLNMAEIRKTGLFEKAVALCAKKKIFLPDQTAIYNLTKRKYILPRKYNEQKRYDREDTVIQHFTKTILWLPYFHTRNIKPWETEKVSEVLTKKYDGILAEYKAKKKEFEEKQNETE